MSSKKRNVNKITPPKKKKRKIFRYFFFLLLLLGIGAGTFYLYNHPVLINQSLTNVSVQSEYNPKEAISFVFFGKKDDVVTESNVDVNKLGTYQTTYIYNNYKIKIPVKVIDDVPPVLVLKEYKTDIYNDNIQPEDFIVECKDSSEVKTKFKKKLKDKTGKSQVVIEAVDAYGNSTKESTFLTREKDSKAPKIEFTIDSPIFIEGEPTDYMDGVKITDNLDSNPKVETNAEQVVHGGGDFVITYTVTDRSGNTSKKDRSIHVEEIPEEEQRIVYLTFDDGPSNNTERVLDILAEHNVKATFFLTGNGQSRNELIKREYAEGHSIGLHSYTHDYAIYQSEETYYNDLNAISDMVYDLIGIRSNIIRFPGGSSNTISANYCEGIMSRLVESVTANGLYYFDWNVSSSDASGNNVDVEQIIGMSESGDGLDHIVLLMHDTDAKDTTVEALPEIIRFYKDRGYIFKGLSYRSPECHHGVNN